ncbi:abortive infection bacteriophage resistance protein [Enterococcus xiangfangensis]|nr:Abi family protein [Enterococcus xiangfangensis]MBM7711500.1 abortive infection bacteriophage resistance protein [Enterococcus xiangfangensis]
MKYDRCATTIEEQVDILEDRGLIIEDRSFAIAALKKIGYFRFKGYCLPFYKSKDKFWENVTFFSIYQNYRFDERFRLLLFQIIEHVEVELKSIIARDFALETSPLGFYDPHNFDRLDFHESWLEKFKQLTSQSSKRRELYTDHYIKNYDNIFPVWVAMEMSDFGSLSKFFYNINRPLRNKISKKIMVIVAFIFRIGFMFYQLLEIYVHIMGEYTTEFSPYRRSYRKKIVTF